MLNLAAESVGAPYAQTKRSDLEDLAAESSKFDTLPLGGFGGHVHVLSSAHGEHAGCIIYPLDNKVPLYGPIHGESSGVGCIVMGLCTHSNTFTVQAHEFSPDAERVYDKLAQDQRQLCAAKFRDHFDQMPDDAKAMIVAAFANLLSLVGPPY